MERVCRWRKASYGIVGIHPLWRYEGPLLIHPGCESTWDLATVDSYVEVWLVVSHN
jgi:hypothetical protein